MKKSTKKILSTFSLMFMLLGLPMLNINCSGSAEFMPEKMDTPLQQKIRSVEEDNSNSIIQFTGKTKEDMSSEMKKELESKGIIISSVVTNIFTASGTASAIKEISNCEFVIYMELARTLDIK